MVEQRRVVGQIDELRDEGIGQFVLQTVAERDEHVPGVVAEVTAELQLFVRTEMIGGQMDNAQIPVENADVVLQQSSGQIVDHFAAGVQQGNAKMKDGGLSEMSAAEAMEADRASALASAAFFQLRLFDRLQRVE